MPPGWLTALAWVSLGAAFISAAAILLDIFVGGYRQKMWIMEAVWPVTALYLGALGWVAYRRWGRPSSPRLQRQTGADPRHGFLVSVSIGVSHCGAGCTLGDIIGGFAVLGLGLKLLGLALPAEYIVDYLLAFTLGIAF